jgi:hypothetical protein
LLNKISTFVQKEASRPFLTLLFTKGQRIAQIDQYHRRIGTAVTSFQVDRHIIHSLADWTNGHPRYQHWSTSMLGRLGMTMHEQQIN